MPSLSACCGSFGLWPRAALWGPAQSQTDYIRALIADALPTPHKWWMDGSSCGRERAKDTPMPPFSLPPSIHSWPVPSWALYDEAPCLSPLLARLSPRQRHSTVWELSAICPDKREGEIGAQLPRSNQRESGVEWQVAQSVRGVSVHCDPSMSSMLIDERWSLGSCDSDTIHLGTHIRD